MWTIFASEELSAFALPRHSPCRAWLVAGIFHPGEIGMPCGGWYNEADFTETSNFPEILGKVRNSV